VGVTVEVPKVDSTVPSRVYPHEHVLIALCPVVAYCALRHRRLPSWHVGSAVAVGSLLPDLVDKPLAHSLSLLPSGRVFLHSLPIAIPIAIVAMAYGWQTNRVPTAGGFVVGLLLHPFGDFDAQLRAGAVPAHMLWPLVPVETRFTEPFWTVPWTLFSAVVLACLAVLLARDMWVQLRTTERRDASD